MKKHIFLWSSSSCYVPEPVFTHVTESSLMGFSGTGRKALECGTADMFSFLLKWLHKACWPDWKDTGRYSWSRPGSLQMFPVPPSTTVIMLLLISLFQKQQREIESKPCGTKGFKILQFCHSWWVFLFSSSSSFPQKSMHIVFTLGVSASLLLLFRQLPGCEPALQNQTLPFILGFAFIILSWISYFFISYYFMPCLLFIPPPLFFVSFVWFLSLIIW